MSVVRVEKTKNYTTMSNYHFKEKEMSLKAKGLLSLMLSLPDTWDYTIAGLVSICKENETAIKSGLNELRQFGYLQIIKKMPTETNTGRIEYEYIIHEKPIQEDKKQDIENLYIESQHIEKHGQLNINKLNTNNKNINIINNINSDNSQNLQIDNLEESKNIIEKPKKELTTRQKNAIERNKILEEFIKDEDDDIKKAIKDYVEIRRKKGLEPKQLQIILEDFEKSFNNKPKAVILEQIRKATARGWMALSYEDNFKGTTKTSYSSKPTFDNTANHNTKIYHISDEDFEKLSHMEKINTLLNDFGAVADMTIKQREFYNQYCIVHDWED